MRRIFIVMLASFAVAALGVMGLEELGHLRRLAPVHDGSAQVGARHPHVDFVEAP